MEIFFYVAVIVWVALPIWLHFVARTISRAWIIGQNEAFKQIQKEIQTNGKTK